MAELPKEKPEACSAFFIPHGGGDMIMGKLRIILLTLILLPVYSGCGGTMSLEKAKQVTVSLETAPEFVPPPRRIDDIISILNEPGVYDVTRANQWRAKADAPAPPNAGSDFYYLRSEAAMVLGRLDQSLEDSRNAVRLSGKESANFDKALILRQAAYMENLVGDYDRAIELYKEALSMVGKTPLPVTQERLSAAYLAVGDLKSAKQTLDSAKAECNLPLTTQRRDDRVVWCNLAIAGMEARLLESQGRYPEAEPYIREKLTLSQYADRSYPGYVRSTRTWLAGNLMRQERLIEAEVEIRRALKEWLGTEGTEGKQTLSSTGGISTMANILRAQGRLPEAEKLVMLNINGLESSGISNDSYFMVRSRIQLGSILAAQGKYDKAMKQFDLAIKGEKNVRYLYNEYFSGNLDYILSLLKTGRQDEALKVVNETYARTVQRFGENNYSTAEARALRGMVNYRLNHVEGAGQDLSNATDALLASRTERETVSRSQRLSVILDEYMKLLTGVQGTPIEKDLGMDAAGTAFRIAEASRNHTVQAALVASSARSTETDPELKDLIRREQDARKQIEIMQAQVLDLLSAPSKEQKTEIISDLRKKINDLNKAVLSLQTEIKKRFPKYADFVNPRSATEALARQNLRPGEALIALYTSDDRTYVWAIPHAGRSSFYSSHYGIAELSQRVSRLRKALDAQPKTFGDILPFDLAEAYEIYREILKPVEAGWSDATDLLIIVQGPLAQLPFSLLPTSPVVLGQETGELFSAYRQVPWLIRRVSITMLPAVDSLVVLRSLPAGNPNRKAFAGFGDPIFNPEQLAPAIRMPGTMADNRELASRGITLHIRGVRISEKGNLDSGQINSTGITQLDRLPDTADEIKYIAQELDADPKQDVFLGKDASKHQVKTMNLADRKVIAFATHALVPGDLDGLNQPALALSSPAVTGNKNDGLLTMGDILKLKLDADWVVLSACNTGAAEGQGAEAISGLGRAFFYAGTRSLLVSMWPVETTSARRLVSETFRMQKGDQTLSRTRALRGSMLTMIDQETFKDDTTGKIVASYAHPLFWAPFVIVGDPGTAVEQQRMGNNVKHLKLTYE
jgi:CHAT domain-containing protein